MDSEYAKILRVVIKQAIANVVPQIPEIIVQEILRAFNCDLSTEIPVVGDGLSNTMVIRVDQIDFFKQMLTPPDVGVGKYYYEANAFDNGIPFHINHHSR